MNILGIIDRYLRILELAESPSKKNELQAITPRVVIFSGKASPESMVDKAVI